MKSNKITVDLNSSELDIKLKDLIEDAPKELLSEVISTYYSFIAQQYINDKEYDKLQTLEGLIDLHNLLREV